MLKFSFESEKDRSIRVKEAQIGANYPLFIEIIAHKLKIQIDLPLNEAIEFFSHGSRLINEIKKDANLPILNKRRKYTDNRVKSSLP